MTEEPPRINRDDDEATSDDDVVLVHALVNGDVLDALVNDDVLDALIWLCEANSASASELVRKRQLLDEGGALVRSNPRPLLSLRPPQIPPALL